MRAGPIGLRASDRDLHLHCFGAFNSQPAQDIDQLAKRDDGCGQQEELARGVLFGEDVVLVVEVVELLR